MLSFANFGAVPHAHASKMGRATELVRAKHPSLMIDGEMQVDTALDMDWARKTFGPILVGMKQPLNVIPLVADAMDIVNLAAYTVVSAQEAKPKISVG
jgi:malate dehydrogenase (oxaloacetate-decarboxylating)(NADP+)